MERLNNTIHIYGTDDLYLNISTNRLFKKEHFRPKKESIYLKPSFGGEVFTIGICNNLKIKNHGTYFDDIQFSYGCLLELIYKIEDWVSQCPKYQNKNKRWKDNIIDTYIKYSKELEENGMCILTKLDYKYYNGVRMKWNDTSKTYEK